jgi:hypothetical protein
MDPEIPVLSLEEEITALMSAKLDLEKKELYSEAHVVADKISQLKQKLKSQQINLLKSSHLTEREILENNFQNELSQFNKTWDGIIEAFMEKCKKELEEFKRKRREDTDEERERLQSTLHMFFKPSSALLNMIKCKEKAVKLGKYTDAQLLLNQIEEVKGHEEARFAEQKRTAVEQGLANFDQAYEKKLVNLNKRQQTGLNELELQRVGECDVLYKKFDNLRREMENTQQIRKNIHEGRHTTAAGRHHQSPNKTFYSTDSSSPLNTAKNNLS